MDENLKSKLGFFFFFFVVFGLLIGGYFYMEYSLNKKDSKEVLEEIISNKIDDDKDYIYFINDDTISEGAEIYYKDVVINLKKQNVLTESLEKENKIYKNNINYLTEEDLNNKEIITYNYDNIKYLTFRDYKKYDFGKYVSLLISDYNYSCYDGVTFNNSFAYVFDIKEDILLSDNDLLNMYNLNTDIIKEKVKSYLEEKQSNIDGVDVIKIDETLDNLKMNDLYINEYGKLSISYLVKTTQTDYNEITEVN